VQTLTAITIFVKTNSMVVVIIIVTVSVCVYLIPSNSSTTRKFTLL